MMRILVIFCVVAACAVYVPILYERNPDAFGKLLSFGGKQDAAPSPAVAPGSARLEAKAEPEVMLGKKVSIPVDRRGHFYADFKLNGRSVEAVVDTGATVVAINRSTARRIGIDPKSSDFAYEVGTANGTTHAAAATIGSMQIGRIYMEDVPAMVLQDEALDDTLVGMSFLGRLKRYQVENGALLLEQ